MSHDETVRYAERWDPQPFHVDDDAAGAGHFGEVIAIGLHKLGVFQRLAVLGAYRHLAVLAVRAIRNIEFPCPCGRA